MAAERAKLAAQNASDFETVPDFVDRRKSYVLAADCPPNPRSKSHDGTGWLARALRFARLASRPGIGTDML